MFRVEFVLSYRGYVLEDIAEAVGDTLRQRLEKHTRDDGKATKCKKETSHHGLHFSRVHSGEVMNLNRVNSCAGHSLDCKEPILLAPGRPSWKNVETNPYKSHEK